MSISMPKALKDAIKQAADKDRRSISNFLVKQLETLIESENGEQK